MARLPEGTITFMLTDLQGTTQAWERQPKAMRSAMARHDAILGRSVRDHAGALVEAGREGDSMLAVFRTAGAAAACALDIQKNFAGESWPEGLELKVRVALHTGEAQLREGHYFGPALNRCARLLATCHPGQILLTKATEAMLADEPGAELQDLGLHRLKDLARPEQVFQLKELATSIEFPPIRSLSHQQTNLPQYLDTFVGRSAELAELKSALARSRMITLTGAGGSGKTRLAAELGRACLGDWPGGVWWVDLAPVDDPIQVPGAVVDALQLPGQGSAQEVVIAWLAARRAVLVLDNCEHLVAACAKFCRAALERCPQLTILATSRESLGVPGEVRQPVLAMPPADALQLFEARARLVVLNYTITASNRGTVSQICDRMDGMPLAIELAAARLDTLTEQEVLIQLSDRFRLLKAGSRTAPERQQTMMATIDWSYRLLTEEEALLFRRLSVFRGGFTLETAQAICGEGRADGLLDILTGLVRKSMVVAERQWGAASRYRLLESQAEYGEGQLRDAGELELIRRRHYEYFRDSLEAKAYTPTGGHRAQLPPAFEVAEWEARESSNFLAALGWARENADDCGLSLAANWAFAKLGDISQVRRMLTDVLDNSPTYGLSRVVALRAAAGLACDQGDYDAAHQAAARSIALARKHGDLDGEARGLHMIGVAYECRGRFRMADKTYAKAILLLKDSANRRLLTWIRNSVGLLAADRDDYPTALSIGTECLAIAKDDGDDIATAKYLETVAWAQWGLNDYKTAASSWKEMLMMHGALRDRPGMIACLNGLSCAAGAGGDDGRAARLAAAADRMSMEWGLRSEPWILKHRDNTLLHSRSALGIQKAEDARNAGWQMSFDQAIDYALGGSEPETAVDAGPLSLREREVVTLVAAGMTNREIAKRLFISERTAEGHLEHIRNKLGVRSRTEIATWAVQRGLAKAVPEIS